jgi:hypothetical protein
MEYILSSVLSHKLSNLLPGASYQDLKLLSHLLENSNISMGPDHSILFYIGHNDWNSLARYGIPALDAIYSLIPGSSDDDTGEMLECLEVFDPMQIQNSVKTSSPEIVRTVLSKVSRLLVHGSYKKNKEIAEVLHDLHYDVSGDARIWYLIGLNNWEEAKKFGDQAAQICFEYLKESMEDERTEIMDGIVQFDESYTSEPTYRFFSDRTFGSSLFTWAFKNTGSRSSRLVLRLLATKTFLSDDHHGAVLSEYSDVLVPWLYSEVQSSNLTEIDSILNVLYRIDRKNMAQVLTSLKQRIDALAADRKEAEKILSPWFVRVFSDAIDEDNWVQISELASIISGYRQKFDIVRFFTRKQSLYYWIGIKAWKSVELFTDIGTLVSPSFFTWLSSQFRHSTPSDLASMVHIYQRGHCSLEYGTDWYDLYQWQQIGIALRSGDVKPVDQFGSPVIPKLVELFTSATEQEQEFLFTRFLRYDADSLQNSFHTCNPVEITVLKNRVLDILDELSYPALVRILPALDIRFEDILMMNPSSQLIYTIGSSAFHLLRESLEKCSDGRELILTILPTTPPDLIDVLIGILLEHDDPEQLAHSCVRILKYYNPPKYCIPGEREKLQGSHYLSAIFSDQTRSDRVLSLLSLAVRYEPGVMKEISAPNFNIVTRWLSHQFIPRDITSLSQAVQVWRSFEEHENKAGNQENTACYYIGLQDWDSLKQLRSFGIDAILQCFMKSGGNGRLHIVSSFDVLGTPALLEGINKVLDGPLGSDFMDSITGISNPGEVSTAFLQLMAPEHTGVYPSLENLLLSSYRLEIGTWLNRVITEEHPVPALRTAVYILDTFEWYILGIEAKTRYLLLKREWKQVLHSGTLPEKIGALSLQDYLCQEIQVADPSDLPAISRLLARTGYLPERTSCGVFCHIGAGEWMEIPKFGDTAIPPLLTLLSSPDPLLVKRVILILDLEFGKNRIGTYVMKHRDQEPRLVSPVISLIRVSHPEAIRFCLDLFSPAEGIIHVSPLPNAFQIWLRDYILPYSDWTDLIHAIKILDEKDVSIVEGNAFQSILNLWEIVDNLGDDGLPLYLRLLFSHNAIIIERAIEKLSKIGTERVTAYLLKNPQATDRIFSEFETPEEKAIQYILKLLSRQELFPVIPKKKVCPWFRRTLSYFAWCDLFKAATLIETYCAIEPFLRNRYYIIGKRQWKDVEELFKKEPGRLVAYLHQAPESDQAKLIGILGRIGNIDLIESMTRCLESPYSSTVRVSAIGALTNLISKNESPEKMKFLFKRFEMLSDPDPFIITEIIRTLQKEDTEDIADCIITILEKESIKADLLMTAILGTEKNPDAVSYIINLLADQDLPRCDELFSLFRSRSEFLLKFWLDKLKRKYPLFIKKIITIEHRLSFGCEGSSNTR